MRDIIWTIIVVWIVWKIIDAFSTLGKSRARASFNPSGGQQQQHYRQQNYQQQQQQAKREGEVHVDKGEPRTSHFKPEDGEYVDYEEIK